MEARLHRLLTNINLPKMKGPRRYSRRSSNGRGLVEDVVVGFEDAVREPIVAHELPDALDRIELGRFRRQRQERDVVWDGKPLRDMPSRLIKKKDVVADAGLCMRRHFDQLPSDRPLSKIRLQRGRPPPAPHQVCRRLLRGRLAQARLLPQEL